jgi:hypothetical protein
MLASCHARGRIDLALLRRPDVLHTNTEVNSPWT